MSAATSDRRATGPQADVGDALLGRRAQLTVVDKGHLFRSASVLSALNWLLLGGATKYFPETLTLRTVVAHIQLHRGEYTELLDRSVELYPKVVVEPLRVLVERASLSTADSRAFADPEELQRGYQTAWQISNAMVMDQDVQAFLCTLFDPESKPALKPTNRPDERDSSFRGSVKFVQFSCALSRVLATIRYRVYDPADVNKFAKMVWQLHGILCNAWSAHSFAAVKNNVQFLLRLREGGKLNGFDYLHGSTEASSDPAVKRFCEEFELLGQCQTALVSMPRWASDEGDTFVRAAAP